MTVRPLPANRSAPLADALLGAADLLNGVLQGRTLDSALAAAKLTGAVRAAAMDLAYSTLRDFGRGDLILGQLLTTPLKEAAVRGLLLAALCRLDSRPEDAHTTVDQAVEAAARLANGRFKALANGVLRSYLRRAEEMHELAEADEVARLRHPAWWIARLKQDHPQTWQAILAAGNSRPPMSLRVNRRRAVGNSASADFLARLAAAGIEAASHEGDAIQLLRPVPVDRIPGFAEGFCSVQDLGAQRAAGFLDCADGMRVLDACAAPGGKTAHLLERNELDLLALDSDPARAQRVTENLARLGLSAKVVAEDCRDRGKWWDGRPFERILADVPCTASGVVRRHPDAKWLRRAGDVGQFARTQAEILDALWPTLAPGGRMLYATCSVFAAENPVQLKDFLGRHADAALVALPGLAESQLQLVPDAGQDGFFYALLQRR